MMHTMTSDLAQTKAIRRRNLREAFPYPLNQIALRHVDSVAALNDAQRLILSRAIQKTDLRHAGTFLEALNKDIKHLQNEDALVALIPATPVKKAEGINDFADTAEVDPADIDTLVSLLLKCYPDMPTTSADALARADVMETSLLVVRETRNAIQTANSDFVVVSLFTLFEEKLNELKELINGNPAFIKAIQLSRPDWKSGH
jgi:hypothetical protein